MSNAKLRSQEWFGRTGKDGFIYRAWMKNQGIPDEEFRGKPVIGICNTWSELTPCNGHFRELAESVKRGVIAAGGFPVEFPVMSLGETLIKPTAMLYRNLASMDVEESIRANPIDGVVLLCGCDKTTPSLVMGACSVDIPTIVVSGGPMLTGKYEGKNIGTSDIWRFNDAVRSGEMSQEELTVAEACMCRSKGHCAVMGTASTMACMVESLGLTLPSNAAIPAADSRRKVLAQYSGRQIVEMVKQDLKPSDILTRAAFENAIKVNAAIGGSTNFVIHLIAIARRIGVDLTLDADVIATLETPFKTETGLAVLKGNLCPDGAVIKPSAASPHLMKHTGPAVVFENIEDYHANVDNSSFNIEANSIMVLKNVGPVGYPGMPEVGNMGIPKKLLEQGVTDLIRISDGRMSGTGFGTVVLHVSPEAAKGGLIAVVKTGDMISLDVENRTLELLVDQEEIEKRKAAWKPSHPQINRGYVQLYQQHVEQAHLGADMDFLKGGSGSKVTRDSH